MNFANLFSPKKVTSLSESELGATLSFGIDFHSEWRSGQKLELTFGGLSIDKLTYNTASQKGLMVDDLNYLVGFKYKSSIFKIFQGIHFFLIMEN